MDPTTAQNLRQWPANPPVAQVPTIESREELVDPESLVGKAVSLAIGTPATAKRFGVKLKNNDSEQQRILFYIDGVGSSDRSGVHGRVLLSPTDAVPALIDAAPKWLYPASKRIWCPMNELFTAHPVAGLELASGANAEQFIRQAKEVQKRREADERASKKGSTLSGMLSGLFSPVAAASKVFGDLKLPKRPAKTDAPKSENQAQPKPPPQPRPAPQQQASPIEATVINPTEPDLADLTFGPSIRSATSGFKFGKRTAIYGGLVAAAGLSVYAVLDGWIKPSHFMGELPRIDLTTSQWDRVSGKTTSQKDEEARKELTDLKTELKGIQEQRAAINKELESIRDGLLNQIRATEDAARKRTALQ